MATATLKRTRAGNVSKTALDQVGSLLLDLPEKTKEKLSLRDAVAQLQEVIKVTLAKGYSYEDVATLLAEQEIAISPSTLRNYVLANGSRTAQKQTPSETRTKRTSKTSSTESIAPIKSTKGRRKSMPAAAQPEVAVESPRRGRASKAASAQPTAEPTQRSSTARGRRAKA